MPTSASLYWGWHLTACPRSHRHLCQTFAPGKHTQAHVLSTGRLSTGQHLDLAQHSPNVRVYQDFVRVVFFSVIKGLVGSIVENQIHSLWGPCRPQYCQTQSAGQLTDCHTNLMKQTLNLAEGNATVIKQKEKSTPPLAPWTSMVSLGLIWALEHTSHDSNYFF